MTAGGKKKLTYQDAARWIYRTETPTPVQINKVGHKVACGLLAGDAEARWVSTEAVVQYMARLSEKRRLGGKTAEEPSSAGSDSSRSQARRQPRPDATARDDHKKLPPLYRRMVRDYLNALVRRRELAERSSRYRWAVRAGQLVLIGVVVLTGTAVLFDFTPSSDPAEWKIAEEWVAVQTDGEYTIVEMYPPSDADEPDSCMVRVRYKYYTRVRRPILTDRVLTIRGDEVVAMSSWDGRTGD